VFYLNVTLAGIYSRDSLATNNYILHSYSPNMASEVGVVESITYGIKHMGHLIALMFVSIIGLVSAVGIISSAGATAETLILGGIIFLGGLIGTYAGIVGTTYKVISDSVTKGIEQSNTEMIGSPEPGQSNHPWKSEPETDSSSLGSENNSAEDSIEASQTDQSITGVDRDTINEYEIEEKSVMGEVRKKCGGCGAEITEETEQCPTCGCLLRKND